MTLHQSKRSQLPMQKSLLVGGGTIVASPLLVLGFIFFFDPINSAPSISHRVFSAEVPEI
jgi:hypothetical protein